MITPRLPDIDFSDVPVHWSPNHELAQSMNAKSTAAPLVEPYLNRVMARVRSKLPPEREELKQEVDLFIKQEGLHYRVHSEFNQRIYDAGYTEIKVLEDKMKADYAGFLKDKSLMFNLAYCVGFETSALNAASFFYEEAGDLLEGADPRIVDLWLWHTGEEYEHRAVCEDAFRAMRGGYFLRIYGLLYAYVHLGRYYAQSARALLRHDRAGMSEAELAASLERSRVISSRFKRYFLPKMWRLFLPWYDASKAKPPRGLEAKLAQFRAV